MTTRKRSAGSTRPPATTPVRREKQLIALAVDLAEKQILEGTASAQVITHFLRLATTREKLEQQKLAGENKLLDAKVEQIASASRYETLLSEALAAMKSYQGRGSTDESEQ